jgi:hypothetical protein
MRSPVRVGEDARGDVVEVAGARGWVQVEGNHIALTEAGRLLAKDLGRI